MSKSIADSITPNSNKNFNPQSSGRIEWIDYAKGITIFLVVYSHVLIGVYNSQFNISYSFYIHSIKFMYSFHMPVFFFLSGIFAIKSSAVSLPDFLIKKLKIIAYPYLIWSLIQGCIYAFMSPFTNFKFSLGELPTTILFNPLMQLWFLYILFFTHALFFLINRLSGKYNYYILLTVALVMYFFSGYIKIHIISKIFQFFLYYVLGHVLTKKNNIKKYLTLNRIQILCFTVLFVILELMIVDLNGNIDYIGNPLQSLFLACMGIALIISISIYLSQAQNIRFILEMGKLSLPIYLMHILTIVGFRIFFNKIIGINNVIFHIAIGLLSGLLLPIVIYKILIRNIKFTYLFSYGQ